MSKGEEVENSIARTESNREAVDVVALHQAVLHELQFDICQREIPALKGEDVEYRSLLGSGSFSEVFSVHILLDSWVHDKNDGTTDEGSLSELEKDALPRCCFRTLRSMSSHTSSVPKYVIKTLRQDFKGKKEMISLAVRDAYYEAEILSHLPPHPNIVNLVAVSHMFWGDPTQGFLILERLEETLKHRMARWIRAAKSNKRTTSFFQFMKRRRERLHQQRSRIECCGVGIARAFKFLHKHGIVYRDLKPTNIGFGYDGNVKLFDFGLARRHVPLKDQPRRLTGDAGNARYMAPEVSLHEEYSLPADVHSYAILLWEICTLEKPYGNVSSLDQLKQRTVQSHHRPSLRKIASLDVRNLLNACWEPEPRVRPTFTLILKGVETAAGVAEN